MVEVFPHSRSHARARCQARGTKRRLYELLHAYADVTAFVGRGATALSVSRRAACEMRADGVTSDAIDQARQRSIVEIDGRPLTLIAGRERSGRHYFRNRPHGQSDKRAKRRR